MKKTRIFAIAVALMMLIVPISLAEEDSAMRLGPLSCGHYDFQQVRTSEYFYECVSKTQHEVYFDVTCYCNVDGCGNVDYLTDHYFESHNGTPTWCPDCKVNPSIVVKK